MYLKHLKTVLIEYVKQNLPIIPSSSPCVTWWRVAVGGHIISLRQGGSPTTIITTTTTTAAAVIAINVISTTTTTAAIAVVGVAKQPFTGTSPGPCACGWVDISRRAARGVTPGGGEGDADLSTEGRDVTGAVHTLHPSSA